MHLETMRKNISDVYPSIRWKTKVRDMKPEQVYAIYYKFLENGTFDKKRINDKRYRQMTIFDFITTKGDVLRD